MTVPAAARELDYIQHDHSRLGRFIGLLITIGADALPITIAAVGGPVGWAFAGAFWLIKWQVNKAVEDAFGALGGLIESDGGPEVVKGSPNVFINNLSAARGGPDGDKLNCFAHGDKKIEAGSLWIYVNNKPAARIKVDHTGCDDGATLRSNPASPQPTVFFGGEPTEYDNTYWFHDIVDYGNIARGILGAALDKSAEGLAALLQAGATEAAPDVAEKVADYLWVPNRAQTFPDAAPSVWQTPAGAQ